MLLRDQTVDISTGRRWYVSAVTTAMWKTTHFPDIHADFYGHSIQAVAHYWWKCIDSGGNYVEKIIFCSWEFAQSNSNIVLSVFVVVSTKTNRKHYFQRDLRTRMYY